MKGLHIHNKYFNFIITEIVLIEAIYVVEFVRNLGRSQVATNLVAVVGDLELAVGERH